MSATNPSIPEGNPVKITVVFNDETGSTYDPDRNIAIDVTYPDERTVSYGYPGDLTKEGVGTYSIIIAALEVGVISAQGRAILASGLQVTSTKVYQKITHNF